MRVKLFVDKEAQTFEHKPKKADQIKLADENLRGVRGARSLGASVGNEFGEK